jgi:hypothetical protein
MGFRPIKVDPERSMGFKIGDLSKRYKKLKKRIYRWIFWIIKRRKY